MTQKEVEPLHLPYTITVGGDVVFRFLGIGLNHFPSLWCGGQKPPPPLPPKLNFFFPDRFLPRVGGFRRDNVKVICLLGHDKLGKSKGINSAQRLQAG